MSVVGDECGSKTTENYVGGYYEWDNEAGCVDIYAGKSSGDLGATKDETSSNEHIGCEAKE